MTIIGLHPEKIILVLSDVFDTFRPKCMASIKGIVGVY